MSAKRRRKQIQQETENFLAPAPDEGGPGDHMSEDLFQEATGEVENALFQEAMTTARFRELKDKMGNCRPQLNKERHAQWRDIMSVLTEKGINRYTNQVNFENETNEESERGGVEDGELKTSGMPTKENDRDEDILC